MSEFLSVRLSSQQDAVIPWLVWSSQQEEVIASGEIFGWDQLGALATYAAQRSTIVLCASSDVMLTDVTIPSGASRQFESMLPYLVEDDIAQDVDELHFSVLKKDGDVASIAAIDRAWLSTCLAKLKDVGMNVKKVLPDVLALPKHEGMSALQIGSEWLIRKDEYEGISVESDWLPLFSHSSWVKDGDTYLSLESYTPLPELELDSEQSWREITPQLVMELLTKQAIDSKVNLLTGAFKTESSWLKSWQVWKKVVWAGLFFFVVSLGQHVLQVRQYEAEALSYREESERIFRMMLPDKQKIPTVTYLKRQMNDEAARFGGANAEGTILEWLTNLSANIKNIPSMQLQSLRFDSQREELRLEAQSNDFQSFEKAQVALTATFEVEQGQLNRNGDVVSGSFVLKRKGAN